MDSTSSAPGSFAKDCYDKANEAFTNEQYAKAVEKYGEALAHDPLNVDYLCARAHALIKNEEFEKAKLDANKAIGTIRIIRTVKKYCTQIKPNFHNLKYKCHFHFHYS